jgi:hypothetical protein
MTQDGTRLERFLERAVGLGATASLHPARLLQEIHEAAQASVRDGSIANAYRVTLAPDDAEFFGPHQDRLQREIVRLLDDLSTRRRLERPGPWLIEFAAETGASPGLVRVEATFRNPVAAGSAAPPTGATQAITRHRGKFLIVEGLGRVAVTHTPFVLGRGRECDLTIPDLAISRRHARLETLPDGRLLLRDLGSRNQLGVHGGKLSEVVLTPGLRVELGSTAMWLEVEE